MSPLRVRAWSRHASLSNLKSDTVSRGQSRPDASLPEVEGYFIATLVSPGAKSLGIAPGDVLIGLDYDPRALAGVLFLKVTFFFLGTPWSLFSLSPNLSSAPLT